MLDNSARLTHLCWEEWLQENVLFFCYACMFAAWLAWSFHILPKQTFITALTKVSFWVSIQESGASLEQNGLSLETDSLTTCLTQMWHWQPQGLGEIRKVGGCKLLNDQVTWIHRENRWVNTHQAQHLRQQISVVSELTQTWPRMIFSNGRIVFWRSWQLRKECVNTFRCRVTAPLRWKFTHLHAHIDTHKHTDRGMALFMPLKSDKKLTERK